MTQQVDQEQEYVAPAAPQFADAHDDDGSDEWDPTNAPAYVQLDEEESAELFDGEDLTNDDEAAEWTPEDALLDYTGTLAVWVNEEGGLERAQLVRYWRDRARQQPLESMFEDVFSQLQLEFPGEPEKLPQPKQIDPNIELNGELLDRMDDATAELDERLRQLIENDEGYSQWKGEPVSAKDSRGKVTVTLTMFGQPESVEIDSRAIDELTGSQICRCVIDAYHRARAKYREPEFEAGERFEIAEEYMTIARTVEIAAENGLSYLPRFENSANPERPSDSPQRQER